MTTCQGDLAGTITFAADSEQHDVTTTMKPRASIPSMKVIRLQR